MQPLKATLLDDDAFRLLAIPFGGPIPSPHSPRGVDLDGEWFDERTDITADILPLKVIRAVDWHHGKDGTLARTTIGKAVDPEMDEDGWWVTVWLDHGERRLKLIKALAERGAQLFGSSESIPGKTAIDKATGHIDVWPYWRQTLSTSPQNTYSVMRPMKAALGAPLSQSMRDLAADLRLTLLRPSAETGEDVAKYRRAAETFYAATLRLLDLTKNR